MNRFMTQAKKGKVEASPELVKLWGTPTGRAMVRHFVYICYMLYVWNLAYGFGLLCMYVKKWHLILGGKLRELLYKYDMEMDLVNLNIERELIQDLK